MNGLLLDDFVLDVVFLFLVFILSGSWILGESLSGVWRGAFVLPELASFRFCEETLWFLSDEHAIRIVTKMIVSLFLDGNHSLVCSRSWSETSIFRVLAVWNATLEHFVLASRVKLLLSHLIEIIHPWSWILCPAFVVMSVIRLLEQLPIDFTSGEIKFRISLPNCWLFWIVSSGSDLIESVTCICCLS